MYQKYEIFEENGKAWPDYLCKLLQIRQFFNYGQATVFGPFRVIPNNSNHRVSDAWFEGSSTHNNGDVTDVSKLRQVGKEISDSKHSRLELPIRLLRYPT